MKASCCVNIQQIESLNQLHLECFVNKKLHQFKEAYRDCIKRQGDKTGLAVLLILPESMSQSRHHRDYDMESGSMSNTANPVLSPYLFIQSLYAPFLKFVGLFIYLSPLIFIHTQCKSLSGGGGYKIPLIDTYGVPKVSFHPTNTKIHMCINFRCMVCKFEK